MGDRGVKVNGYMQKNADQREAHAWFYGFFCLQNLNKMNKQLTESICIEFAHISLSSCPHHPTSN